MGRGKPLEQYQREIRDDAYVRVYSANKEAKLQYPYRLNHVGEDSPTAADLSENFIIDSSFQDDSVGNADVLERAAYLDADVAIPADVPNDPLTTTDRVLEFYQRREDHEWDGDVMWPLQADDAWSHADHYHDLRETLVAHGYDEADPYVAIGGIMGRPQHEQLAVIVDTRLELGHDVYLHGLGLGSHPVWIMTVQRCPWLLDSLDMASPIRDLVNGKLTTKTLQRTVYSAPRGQASSALTAMLGGYVMHLVCYMFGPYVRDDELPTESDLEGPNARRVPDLLERAEENAPDAFDGQ